MRPNDGDVTNGLEQWLARASRRLSSKSRASVRAEIQQHYDLALEEELDNGVAPEEAGRRALASLGDANEVNRGYRQVLLTRQEARLLCEVRWKAGVLRRHPALKAALVATPFVLLAASVSLTFLEKFPLAKTSAVMGLFTFLFFTAQFLPLHTRGRAQAFRIVKYAAVGALFLAVLPLENWYNLFWIAYWAARGWMRASLRRKLPEPEWPKSLYI